MKRSSIARVLLLVAAPLLLALTLAGAVRAQAPEGETIAEGLNGPMGVLVDPQGDIWVIDSGVGGETVVSAFDPNSGQVVTATVGDSSRIVKVSMADGSQSEIAVLPSLQVGQEATGGARLTLLDGELYATSGVWVQVAMTEPLPLTGSIVKIGADGEVSEAAAVWTLEADQNPDGTAVLESHPYGLAAGPDGMLWTADAGANMLVKADPATGEVSLAATFEPLPGVFPNPGYNGEMLRDAVPTGIAFKDGEAYVSYLTGAPFLPGTASVVKVDEDGSVTPYAGGLTMLTDLRTAPDGDLYAVQFGLFTDQGPVPNSGALIRVGEGDASEVVIGGLSFPTSVDFSADGDAYVTVNGAGAPGSGAVVKYAGVTEMEGTPLSEAMAAMMPPAGEMEASAGMTETMAAEEPTAMPAEEPTAAPMEEPTTAPAEEPTTAPMEEPTTAPAEEPTTAPAEEPTTAPMEEPTAAPAEEPTPETLPVTGADRGLPGGTTALLLTAAVLALGLIFLALRRRTV